MGPLFDQLIPLFLLLGLGAAFWLVLASRTRQAGDAEGVVCDRYARGEITREQYFEILHDLRHSGGKP